MTDFKDHVLRFMDRFNAGDLDGALNDFANDGQYIDEFGNTHRGRTELRKVLTPILDGSYGSLAYTIEEMILDPENSKALVTWTLRITNSDNSVNKIRGLDVLDFEGEKVRSKNCYIKSRDVLIEPVA